MSSQQAYPFNSPNVQTISGNTTLVSQRDLLTVTAAAKITLPAVSTWPIGKTTRVVYRGTSAVTIEIIADAADKIEGSARVALYGTDIIAEFTPIAANKVVVDILRGVMAWLHCSVDLTAASGASPWSLTSNNGDTTTWTDGSSASNSVAASAGFLHTSTTVSYFTSGLGSIVRTPLSGLKDSWGRPASYRDRMYVLIKTSRTTGSSADCNLNVGLAGASSAVPRIDVTNDTSAGLRYVHRGSGTTASQTAAVARLTAAHWFGLLYDPNMRSLTDCMMSTSPTGDPGVDWWPWSYSGSGGIAFGQGDHTAQDPWAIASITDVNIAQTGTGGANNDKFTDTAFALLQYRKGLL